MKKVISVAFALIMFITLVACNEQTYKEQITIYSYSGENEQYSLINGIIMLSEDKDIIYGGKLNPKDEQIANLVSDNMKLYVLVNNEEITLTSFSSVESGGDGFSLRNPGSCTAQISEDEKENLLSNLYFRLSVETLSGEKIVSDIKLNVVDVTGIFEN